MLQRNALMLNVLKKQYHCVTLTHSDSSTENVLPTKCITYRAGQPLPNQSLPHTLEYVSLYWVKNVSNTNTDHVL